MAVADAAAVARRAVTLASLPAVYLRLCEVANEPNSTTQDVVRVISEDTSLAARLLKLVNSASYGFTQRIDTVTQALNLVGTRQVQDLALASSVLRAFSGIPKELCDLDRFWRHSIATALGARMIATLRRDPNPERFFVAGLLHDVGRLVLYLHEPAAMAEAIARARTQGESLRDAERAVLGYDHALVGGHLLEQWKLPVPLQDIVRRHHSPERAGPVLAEASAVHVADLIAVALELGSSGEELVPALNPSAWTALALAPDALATIAAEVDRQHADVVQIMLAYEYRSADAPAAAAAR